MGQIVQQPAYRIADTATIFALLDREPMQIQQD
jgi:hypothetical protein